MAANKNCDRIKVWPLFIFFFLWCLLVVVFKQDNIFIIFVNKIDIQSLLGGQQ